MTARRIPHVSADAREPMAGPHTTAKITPAATPYSEPDRTPRSTRTPPKPAQAIQVHRNASQGVIDAMLPISACSTRHMSRRESQWAPTSSSSITSNARWATRSCSHASWPRPKCLATAGRATRGSRSVAAESKARYGAWARGAVTRLVRADPSCEFYAPTPLATIEGSRVQSGLDVLPC